MPDDFRELWPQLGWDAGKAHWCCDGRKIAVWLDEAGRVELSAARDRFKNAQGLLRSRERRKRYVLGRTLSRVG